MNLCADVYYDWVRVHEFVRIVDGQLDKCNTECQKTLVLTELLMA